MLNDIERSERKPLWKQFLRNFHLCFFFLSDSNTQSLNLYGTETKNKTEIKSILLYFSSPKINLYNYFVSLLSTAFASRFVCRIWLVTKPIVYLSLDLPNQKKNSNKLYPLIESRRIDFWIASQSNRKDFWWKKNHDFSPGPRELSTLFASRQMQHKSISSRCSQIFVPFRIWKFPLLKINWRKIININIVNLFAHQ